MLKVVLIKICVEQFGYVEKNLAAQGRVIDIWNYLTDSEREYIRENY